MRTICAISDTHAGHENGLLSPDTVIERVDENGNVSQFQFSMSEINKHLWNIHSMIVERAKEADDLVLFHIGDVVQGTKYLDGCLTSNLHEQIEIAYQNIIEFYRLENLKVARIITGTRSHETALERRQKYSE